MNKSDDTPLKQAVREKISEPRLDETQLSKINARFDMAFTPPKLRSNIAIAALALFFLGVALMAHSQWQNWRKEQLFMAIAQDVVRDHVMQTPVEFQSQDLTQLDQKFTALDFTLVNTIQLPNLHTDLLGGRYCSIQNITTAQLQLQSSDDQMSSLYQLKFDSERFAILGNINVDEQPALRYVKGFSVTLWEEAGVLLALVQAPDTDELGVSSGVGVKGIQGPQLLPPVQP